MEPQRDNSEEEKLKKEEVDRSRETERDSSLDTSDVSTSSSLSHSPTISFSLSFLPLPNQTRKTRSFRVLEGGNDKFEVREYYPATWSTTTFPAGTTWDVVRSKGFDRNFGYIKNAGIAMTAPVVRCSFVSLRWKRDRERENWKQRRSL